MAKTQHQVVDTLKGMGEVYKFGRRIADVSFNLQVQEKYPGFKSISGQVAVIDGEHRLPKDRVLVLDLLDGKYIQFLATHRDGSISGKILGYSTGI